MPSIPVNRTNIGHPKWRTTMTWNPPDFNAKYPIGTLKGIISESHLCIDCGYDTMPGAWNRVEVETALRAAEQRKEHDPYLGQITFGERTECYMVRNDVWAKAGMEPYSGCLCIGCLER